MLLQVAVQDIGQLPYLQACREAGTGRRQHEGRARPSKARPPCLIARYPPKRSNSPFRTPPRNACHSSGVKRSTAPSASRLFRTPISLPVRLATSTQLPLAKLSELFTHTG